MAFVIDRIIQLELNLVGAPVYLQPTSRGIPERACPLKILFQNIHISKILNEIANNGNFPL
jgi:hypothetical protein